jgi:hypothetical protein
MGISAHSGMIIGPSPLDVKSRRTYNLRLCDFLSVPESPQAPWGTSPVAYSWRETLAAGFPPTLASLSASFLMSI